jgi:two-component system response regulator NreC
VTQNEQREHREQRALPCRPAADSSTPLRKQEAGAAAQPHVRRGISLPDDTITVVLADDHAMIREGLRLVLRSAPDISIVGEAEDGNRALHVASRLAPDVVVLDLDMPDTDPVTVLREFARTLGGVRVLILTMHPEDHRLLTLLEAGARGYLTKEVASRDLIDAIRVVAAGEVYVRPDVARLLASAVIPRQTTDTAYGRFKSLADREKIVLRMVAQGFSGVEIARDLGLSTKTVDAYKRRIEEKLGLEHRTHYVRFAIEAGVLGP